MNVDEVRETLRRVLRNQLDDCERAIRNNDERRALSELEDAISKLKRLMNSL